MHCKTNSTYIFFWFIQKGKLTSQRKQSNSSESSESTQSGRTSPIMSPGMFIFQNSMYVHSNSLLTFFIQVMNLIWIMHPTT